MKGIGRSRDDLRLNSRESDYNAQQKKLDVDGKNFEEIDDTLLVRIYNESFDRGYQQGFKEKGMISKPKLRFWIIYLRRYTGRYGIYGGWEFLIP